MSGVGGMIEAINKLGERALDLLIALLATLLLPLWVWIPLLCDGPKKGIRLSFRIIRNAWTHIFRPFY